ncbi:MAG: hypothetical protein PHX80_05570 [Candidatus Nanoarchaeia archaeon]|nr:hypothetical protein [Candidatus Nanoarchaeia archaeon]
MSETDRPQLFFEKQPFATRLTSQEVDYVRENLEELFDGDEGIQPRKGFMMLVEKALYKVKKTTEGLPADKEKIKELEDLLSSSESKYNENVAEFNQLVDLKEDLEAKLLEANQQIEALRQSPNVKEVEKIIERQIDPSTQRLLNLSPLEAFVLAQVEHVHKTDAKGILIDRFFNVYQKRGNGDFDILRISPSKMAEIEAAFKAQQQQPA